MNRRFKRWVTGAPEPDQRAQDEARRTRNRKRAAESVGLTVEEYDRRGREMRRRLGYKD